MKIISFETTVFQSNKINKIICFGMNLSCPISRQEYQLQTLVMIDARHSLYDYRRPFKDFSRQKNQNIQEWIVQNSIYSPLLKQFLMNLKENTSDYVFFFFHKDTLKNQILVQQFEKFCEANSIIITNHIIECNKAHIKFHALKAIKSFLVNNKLQGQIQLPFSQGVFNQTVQLHNLVIVTHNPISFQFASLLSTLNQLYIFKQILLAKCLFSSYFHDAKKKFIIENHFYKYNFKQNFHHISSLNQLISLIEQEASLLQSDSKVNVGYYFYPKKQNELIQLGVLQTSHRIKMVPIDLRFINQVQYDKIHVLFQKILDLNKKKEIKFTEEEVTEMKKNYQTLICNYKEQIYNLDPIHTVPVIAERVQFISWFEQVIQSPDFKKGLTSNIHFKTPKQEIYDNTQNELNGIAQHVIKEIKFPFIVKPRTAAFTSNCHIMAIVVNEEGFYNAMKEKDFKQYRIAFIICESRWPNLQDLLSWGSCDNLKTQICSQHYFNDEDSKCILDVGYEFRQGFVKYDSQLNLAQQVKVDEINNNYVNEELKHEKALYEILKILSQQLSKKFEVSLFGFDVIGDLKKLDFYIIDINHFPGYKNVAKIKELFDDLFLQKVKMAN